jgi:exodeoxyribonuclease VII large subunit
VLIVARGGGSIEDLWAFNEEIVARAVLESGIPIVSGVGHETDFTICDFIADARAPTPTGAASLAVPDRRAVQTAVATIAQRWRRASRHALETRIQRVDAIARRLVHPAARLALQRRDAAALAGRLDRAHRNRLAAAANAMRELGRRVTWLLRQPLPSALRLAPLHDAMLRAASIQGERSHARIAALERSLAHLNPQAVLERGYAIVTAADGAIVDAAEKLAVGDDVALAFARGTADARITRRG